MANKKQAHKRLPSVWEKSVPVSDKRVFRRFRDTQESCCLGTESSCFGQKGVPALQTLQGLSDISVITPGTALTLITPICARFAAPTTHRPRPALRPTGHADGPTGTEPHARPVPFELSSMGIRVAGAVGQLGGTD